ncbi:hypothetical protein FISHEDRAFT_67827 [Fistulina hepatica ATCC 64428]|nr:hypothetical protein FISHEDRAFT_67827 [Fistulina hepatica ATCC 64428]
MYFLPLGLATLCAALQPRPLSEQSRALYSEMCSPNFAGAGVSITNSAREWGVVQPPQANENVTSQTSNTHGMLATVDFLLSNLTDISGTDTNYLITSIQNSSLAVATRDDGTLYLAPSDSCDESQLWNVLCDHCGANISASTGQFSYGCNITAVTNSFCVQIGKKATDGLFLAPCGGIDAQNFDFWTEYDD